MGPSWMVLTHGNVIFDILEPSAFQKYSICWVFRAFFCSTFFYMYFATRPRPALTAVHVKEHLFTLGNFTSNLLMMDVVHSGSRSRINWFYLFLQGGWCHLLHGVQSFSGLSIKWEQLHYLQSSLGISRIAIFSTNEKVVTSFRLKWVFSANLFPIRTFNTIIKQQ